MVGCGAGAVESWGGVCDAGCDPCGAAGCEAFAGAGLADAVWPGSGVTDAAGVSFGENRLQPETARMHNSHRHLRYIVFTDSSPEMTHKRPYCF